MKPFIETILARLVSSTQKMVKNWIVYCSRLFGIIEKSASAGAIVKNWIAVRKCVRNNYKGAKVRAPHSKNPRNPTSGAIIILVFWK